MIELLIRLFSRAEPTLSEASARDAAAIAVLHAASFNRGWSEDEIDRLLIERNVLTHRATVNNRLVGFIMSRMAADESEILSVAVTSGQRGRGLARQLLTLHLRRLAGLGTRTVFLEVGEGNAAARRLYQRAGFQQASRREGYYSGTTDNQSAAQSAALVLRCDLSGPLSGEGQWIWSPRP